MTDAIENTDHELLGTLKRHAGVGMAVGILIMIAGVLALLSPGMAGISVTMALGVLFLLSGVSRLFLAFKMGSFGRGVLVFLLGVLAILAGGYMMARPGMGLATLTLVVAAYFLVDGIFEIIWAFKLRPIEGWGWTLVSGIAAVILSVMIWRHFPESSFWAVGILVGVRLLFGGTALTAISHRARRAVKGVQGRLHG